MSKQQFRTLYHITVHDAVAHLFEVTMTIIDANPAQEIQLPNWIPGSYLIRDFSKNIVTFTVADITGSPVKFEKLNKSTWCIANKQSTTLVIKYQVYAWDLSVRTAHLDQHHAFFNGTSLFMLAVGREQDLALVNIDESCRQNPAWRVATSMKKLSLKQFNDNVSLIETVSDQAIIKLVDSHGFGCYFADDYSELIDHPFEIADLTIIEFVVNERPHKMVLFGKHHVNHERLIRDLTLICQQQVSMFGGLPDDIKEYLFLVTVLENGYGGLEHRSSTALICSRKDLDMRKMDQPTEDYINFLTLCSHEYFHLWNVKRIRPQVFITSDLQSEAYSELLWLFEGVTSYYEDQIALRAGVISRDDYLNILSKVINRVNRGDGKNIQSIAESSYDAWTKFYQQDFNAPNAIVSYYTKGKLVALLLDLLIRERSAGKLSIDNLMQSLWQDVVDKGSDYKGVAAHQIEQYIQDKFAIDVTQFFDDYVYGVKPLPLQSELAKAKVTLQWQAPTDLNDLSKVADDSVHLGATTKSAARGVELVSVFNGGNAHTAGLASGDQIIALNKIAVTKDSLSIELAKMDHGDEVTLDYFRRDNLYTTKLLLSSSEKLYCKLTYDDELADQVSQTIKWID
ncbi:MAG: PDZ domain-containing protein [Kangiellaceae bacterium]|jgi:predicted metalloprotease with PDZ domain|nr:PDZ domain-containing protein [Kangiellaceae bacterium]